MHIEEIKRKLQKACDEIANSSDGSPRWLLVPDTPEVREFIDLMEAAQPNPEEDTWANMFAMEIDKEIADHGFDPSSDNLYLKMVSERRYLKEKEYREGLTPEEIKRVKYLTWAKRHYDEYLEENRRNEGRVWGGV